MAVAQQAVSVAEPRTAAIEEMISRIRTIEREKGLSRETLEEIKAEMIEMACRKELFPLADFQLADYASGRSPMQLMRKDDDHRYALYMSTSVSDKKPPPHNHAAWAVIVGIQGEETSWLYERTDDGSVPGKGTVRIVGEQVAKPGTGVAMMPEDIHSIQGRPENGGRLTFHLYGIAATDKQTGRVAYNEAEGTYKPFPAGPENELRV